MNDKRFRDYGLSVGFLPTGARNTITDVPGVLVGHTTRCEGESVRTGVTIIDPGTTELYKNKVPAAVYVGNGSGKVAGLSQVEEFGTLEAPIALTNTLAVGPVMRAVADIVLEENPDMDARDTVNTFVGETNDGIVNDIHQNVITAADVRTAYESRTSDMAVGCVGAGTGTRAFSWKGGIGSSSRRFMLAGKPYTLGVLMQTNFGGSLCINGVAVGEHYGKNDFEAVALPDGSCMIVVATDAPLSARQLKRVAKRALMGIVRTGSIIAHFSGDYALAFSTSRAGIEGTALEPLIPDNESNTLFLAAMDATEEAVYDALFAAKTTVGRSGNTLEALPVDEVLGLLGA